MKVKFRLLLQVLAQAHMKDSDGCVWFRGTCASVQGLRKPCCYERELKDRPSKCTTSIVEAISDPPSGHLCFEYHKRHRPHLSIYKILSRHCYSFHSQISRPVKTAFLAFSPSTFLPTLVFPFAFTFIVPRPLLIFSPLPHRLEGEHSGRTS